MKDEPEKGECVWHLDFGELPPGLSLRVEDSRAVFDVALWSFESQLLASRRGR